MTIIVNIIAIVYCNLSCCRNVDDGDKGIIMLIILRFVLEVSGGSLTLFLLTLTYRLAGAGHTVDIESVACGPSAGGGWKTL